MKKKYLVLLVVALLVMTAIVGGSLAATSAAGQTATANLAAPHLFADIRQASSAEAALSVQHDALMPGDTLGSTGFIIENTAEVPLYARITITKYWTDETNAKNNTTMDASLIDLSPATGVWLQANDIGLGNSQETQVYYYAVPLQPGQHVDLDLSIALDTQLSNTYQNAGIVLQATVDAVQFAQGENQLNADGLLAAFGVEATLALDGSIVSVVQ